VITTPGTPSQAQTAIILLWLSALVTLLQAVVEDLITNGATVGVVAFVLAIYGLVIFRASRRHNWARYVLLIWAVSGAVVYALDFQNEIRPLWVNMLNAVSFILEFIAVYLLFTGAASEWYRRRESV
jgi:hypothetical protein